MSEGLWTKYTEEPTFTGSRPNIPVYEFAEKAPQYPKNTKNTFNVQKADKEKKCRNNIVQLNLALYKNLPV